MQHSVEKLGLRRLSYTILLLRITQIESGARRSRFIRLNLNQIMTTISEIYTEVAEDADMTLTILPLDTELLIEGDRELLIQQIANLIENALRYCPAGSAITLQGGVTVDEHGGKHSVWVSIEDNGSGIEKSQRERVFERLYRVDKSRTDGGLGLGLSLAKAVAGLHYGTIALYDCQPGLGVCIEIPQKNEQ